MKEIIVNDNVFLLDLRSDAQTELWNAFWASLDISLWNNLEINLWGDIGGSLGLSLWDSLDDNLLGLN